MRIAPEINSPVGTEKTGLTGAILFPWLAVFSGAFVAVRFEEGALGAIGTGIWVGGLIAQFWIGGRLLASRLRLGQGFLTIPLAASGLLLWFIIQPIAEVGLRDAAPPQGDGIRSQILLVDLSGAPLSQMESSYPLQAPRFSPDAKHAVFEVGASDGQQAAIEIGASDGAQIYTVNLDTGDWTSVALPANNAAPVWVDKIHIAFSAAGGRDAPGYQSIRLAKASAEAADTVLSVLQEQRDGRLYPISAFDGHSIVF